MEKNKVAKKRIYAKTHANRPAALRRRAVIDKVLQSVANGKPIPVSKAMLAVGYSPTTSRAQVCRITGSKDWEDTLEERFPDAYLAEEHDKLIQAGELQHYDFPLNKEKKTPPLTNDDIKQIIESVPGCRLIYVKDTLYSKTAYFSAPDNRVRKDAIEMAYKLKRRLTPDALVIDNRKTRIAKLTNKELADLESKLAKDLLLNKNQNGNRPIKKNSN